MKTFPSGWVWLLVAACVVAAVSWYSPPTSYLYITLQNDVSVPQRVDLFYYREGQLAEAPSHAERVSSNRPTKYVFTAPGYFEPFGAIANFGNRAGTWNIHEIGYISRFWLFSLDTHAVSSQAMTSKISSMSPDVQLDPSNRLSVTSRKAPPRLNISLQKHTFNATKSWIATKIAAAILIFLSLFFLYRLIFKPYTRRYIANLFLTRQQDYHQFLKRRAQRIESLPLTLVIGSLTLILVLAIRILPYWKAPGLFIEDTMEFADANSGNSSLWSSDTYFYYRGYFVLLSEWLVALASRFLPSAQPTLYLLFSSTMATIAIIATVNSGLIRSHMLILGAPALLFLATFTDPIFFVSITGVLFSSTMLLLAVLLRPAPKTALGMALMLALVSVLAWSGPYGPQLIPLAFVLILVNSDRRKTLILCWAIVMLLCYLANTSEGMTQLSNIGEPHLIAAFFSTLAGQVFFFGLFESLSPIYGLLIMGVVLLILVNARENRLFIKLALPLLICCFTSMLTFYISTKAALYQNQPLSFHTVMSHFCWALFLLLCLDQLIIRFRKMRPAIALGLISLFSLTGSAVATEYWDGFDPKNRYQPDPMLIEFLAAVDYAKNINLAEKEFIQLWYDRSIHYYDPSVHFGSKKSDATAYPIEDLPPFVAKFLETDFQARPKNVLANYRPKSNEYYFASLEFPRFEGLLKPRTTNNAQ